MARERGPMQELTADDANEVKGKPPEASLPAMDPRAAQAVIDGLIKAAATLKPADPAAPPPMTVSGDGVRGGCYARVTPGGLIYTDAEGRRIASPEQRKAAMEAGMADVQVIDGSLVYWDRDGNRRTDLPKPAKAAS